MSTTITINCTDNTCNPESNCQRCCSWLSRAGTVASMLSNRGVEARARLARSRTMRSKTLNIPNKPLRQKTVLITINPNTEKIDLKKFRILIDKTMHWKMFDTVHWVFEQRGQNADELGKGFHMHAVATLSGKYQNKDVKRDLKRLLRKEKNPVCAHDKHIDVKTLKTERDYNNALNYIKGKKSKNKEDKCLMDIEWREIEEIDEIYLKE